MARDPKVFKLEELASHNSVKDCWLVDYFWEVEFGYVLRKVYDVTEFMDDHPGGGEVLVSSTGKDATEDFKDVGHSKAATEQLEKYYVGDIDESTLPMKKRYSAPQATKTSQDTSGADFRTKILQFLVPLLILGLALVVRTYTRKQDAPSLQYLLTRAFS